MMRILKSLFVVSGLVVAGQVAAQAPPGPGGWNVAWGTAFAVPVSPWVTALLGVLISAMVFAFLRKRSSSGLLVLAVAVLAGGLTAYSGDRLLAALAGPTYPLDGSRGEAFFSCAFDETNGTTAAETIPEVIYIQNHNDDVSVPLTKLERVDLRETAVSIGEVTEKVTVEPMLEECEVGMVLEPFETPGDTCFLYCEQR